MNMTSANRNPSSSSPTSRHYQPASASLVMPHLGRSPCSSEVPASVAPSSKVSLSASSKMSTTTSSGTSHGGGASELTDRIARLKNMQQVNAMASRANLRARQATGALDLSSSRISAGGGSSLHLQVPLDEDMAQNELASDMPPPAQHHLRAPQHASTAAQHQNNKSSRSPSKISKSISPSKMRPMVAPRAPPPPHDDALPQHRRSPNTTSGTSSTKNSKDAAGSASRNKKREIVALLDLLENADAATRQKRGTRSRRDRSIDNTVTHDANLGIKMISVTHAENSIQLQRDQDELKGSTETASMRDRGGAEDEAGDAEQLDEARRRNEFVSRFVKTAEAKYSRERSVPSSKSTSEERTASHHQKDQRLASTVDSSKMVQGSSSMGESDHRGAAPRGYRGSGPAAPVMSKASTSRVGGTSTEFPSASSSARALSATRQYNRASAAATALQDPTAIDNKPPCAHDVASSSSSKEIASAGVPVPIRISSASTTATAPTSTVSSSSSSSAKLSSLSQNKGGGLQGAGTMRPPRFTDLYTAHRETNSRIRASEGGYAEDVGITGVDGNKVEHSTKHAQVVPKGNTSSALPSSISSSATAASSTCSKVEQKERQHLMPQLLKAVESRTVDDYDEYVEQQASEAGSVSDDGGISDISRSNVTSSRGEDGTSSSTSEQSRVNDHDTQGTSTSMLTAMIQKNSIEHHRPYAKQGSRTSSRPTQFSQFAELPASAKPAHHLYYQAGKSTRKAENLHHSSSPTKDKTKIKVSPAGGSGIAAASKSLARAVGASVENAFVSSWEQLRHLLHHISSGAPNRAEKAEDGETEHLLEEEKAAGNKDRRAVEALKSSSMSSNENYQFFFGSAEALHVAQSSDEDVDESRTSSRIYSSPLDRISDADDEKQERHRRVLRRRAILATLLCLLFYSIVTHTHVWYYTREENSGRAVFCPHLNFASYRFGPGCEVWASFLGKHSNNPSPGAGDSVKKKRRSDKPIKHDENDKDDVSEKLVSTAGSAIDDQEDARKKPQTRHRMLRTEKAKHSKKHAESSSKGNRKHQEKDESRASFPGTTPSDLDDDSTIKNDGSKKSSRKNEDEKSGQRAGKEETGEMKIEGGAHSRTDEQRSTSSSISFYPPASIFVSAVEDNKQEFGDSSWRITSRIPFVDDDEADVITPDDFRQAAFQGLVNLEKSISSAMADRDDIVLSLDVARFRKDVPALRGDIQRIFRKFPDTLSFTEPSEVHLVLDNAAISAAEKSPRHEAAERQSATDGENTGAADFGSSTSKNHASGRRMSRSTSRKIENAFAPRFSTTAVSLNTDAPHIQKFLRTIPEGMILKIRLLTSAGDHVWMLPSRREGAELFHGSEQFSLLTPFFGTGTVDTAGQLMALTEGQVGAANLELPYQLQGKGVVWLVVDLLSENVLASSSPSTRSSGILTSSIFSTSSATKAAPPESTGLLKAARVALDQLSKAHDAKLESQLETAFDLYFSLWSGPLLQRNAARVLPTSSDDHTNQQSLRSQYERDWYSQDTGSDSSTTSTTPNLVWPFSKIAGQVYVVFEPGRGSQSCEIARVRDSFYPLRLSLRRHLSQVASLEGALTRVKDAESKTRSIGYTISASLDPSGDEVGPYGAIVLRPDNLAPIVWTRISEALEALGIAKHDGFGVDSPDLIAFENRPGEVAGKSAFVEMSVEMEMKVETFGHGGASSRSTADGVARADEEPEEQNMFLENSWSVSRLPSAADFPILVKPTAAATLLERMDLLNEFDGNLDNFLLHALGGTASKLAKYNLGIAAGTHQLPMTGCGSGAP
ncbi:unnamed protein product [Amoebophrya sp. A25]|nr:unnamed protein product [Amoebophrya sp. A25]|eukprot:GSA25T00007696001.1